MLSSPFVLLAIAALAYKLWQAFYISNDKNSKVSSKLKALERSHETGGALSNMVQADGAGSWPPKATHGAGWPSELLPFHEIYLEMIPLLSSSNPSLDDAVNIERRDQFRALMSKKLNERVDMARVQALVSSIEAGNWSGCSRQAYNGFYCCIGVLRHSYRWAIIPLVKVVQEERIIEFPAQLETTWRHLQRTFGVDSDSGSNTSNVLLNFNQKGERAYKINLEISELVTSTEEAFFRMFYDVEVMAYPMYQKMVAAYISYEQGKKGECLKHMEDINSQLRELLRVFYQNLVESRVAKGVWLSYCQSFQAWGAGRMINGEYVEFDGVSGSHNLCFMVIDAFLGMKSYMNDQNLGRYIPQNQRNLISTFRRNSFFDRLHGDEDKEISDQFGKIIQHLKVFRSAHRARVMPYLAQPAPERMMMTAGKSFNEPGNDDAHLKVLDNMLVSRLKDTIAMASKLLS
ncbi:hypothetical protein FB567DRAFT_565799 [Paraphoma chrysanthemicola]|uniref:Indoleamine 2,3-dioxygenase n=1 Tax=Paraphoma chrysanthemicola TaxID=798071 RepID=A0A8K0RJP8_9PLEO|nr:hypothetical protein FB567DRAFT_565799 [Paraphoma chrysanthemicola]